MFVVLIPLFSSGVVVLLLATLLLRGGFGERIVLTERIVAALWSPFIHLCKLELCGLNYHKFSTRRAWIV